MDKKIIFICQEMNFTTNAMLKTLENDGFIVARLTPDVEKLSKVQDLYHVILYADGPASYDETFLKFLQTSLSQENPIKLYVIGTDNDMFKIFSVLERNASTFIFKRPVNARELIAAINNNQTEVPLKRILVVDDDSTMLRAIKTWLNGKYTVFMANSGMNAISFLAQNSVDLILLDYEMPVVSGLQVFQMLKSEEHTKNIPVIFLTAKDDRETVLKVLEAKPEMYLLKNMPPVKLVKSIDDFFEEREHPKVESEE